MAYQALGACAVQVPVPALPAWDQAQPAPVHAEPGNEDTRRTRYAPVPPYRTPEQQEEARLKALRINRAHKKLLDGLRSGSVTLAEVLERDDEVARHARVVTLLRAVPGYSASSVGRLMATAGIDERRRVGGLSAAQRQRVLNDLLVLVKPTATADPLMARPVPAS